MAVKNPPGIEKMVNYPQFANVEEERYYRKKMLAAAYRIFGKLGFLKAWLDTSPVAIQNIPTVFG